MGSERAYTVDEFAFIGRTFEEYCQVFDLDPDALAGRHVLDCPSGADSFVATASEVGVDVTGVDVLYGQPPNVLARRCRSDVADVAAQLPEKRHLFEWDYYGDVDTRLEYLERATETFIDDYRAEQPAGRYVTASLPSLPFADDSFSLVLSAHLLFLYGDRLDHEFHVASLRELTRVATDEVRIFPLVGLDTELSSHLDAVIDTLRDDGQRVERKSVPFEFQSGATEMLHVRL